jgi:uncharacterized protein
MGGHLSARAGWAAVLAAWTLAGCGGGPEPAVQPAPYLLWRVDGPRGDVYLLGSVHVLRAGDAVGGAATQAAYAAASGLVMELDFDDVDDATLGSIMFAKATDAGGLAEHLGEHDYARAREAAAALGLDLERMGSAEPWFAALGITEMALARLGFDAEHGVEAAFTARARADGKPIAGLETAEFQIGLLDALPADMQREMLFRSIEEAADLPAHIDELLDAWRRGDAEALRADLESSFEPFPDLYRVLIVERNARWLPHIRALLDEPHDTLVIVGALHLIGDDSVVGMLERDGYRVERL